MSDKSIGDIIGEAGKLLRDKGNCKTYLRNEEGQHCAWGALNQVVLGAPWHLARKDISPDIWKALREHLPSDYPLTEGVSDVINVVNFNNRHAGEPVIELFEKTAADLGTSLENA